MTQGNLSVDQKEHPYKATWTWVSTDVRDVDLCEVCLCYTWREGRLGLGEPWKGSVRCKRHSIQWELGHWNNVFNKKNCSWLIAWMTVPERFHMEEGNVGGGHLGLLGSCQLAPTYSWRLPHRQEGQRARQCWAAHFIFSPTRTPSPLVPYPSQDRVAVNFR